MSNTGGTRFGIVIKRFTTFLVVFKHKPALTRAKILSLALLLPPPMLLLILIARSFSFDRFVAVARCRAGRCTSINPSIEIYHPMHYFRDIGPINNNKIPTTRTSVRGELKHNSKVRIIARVMFLPY